MTEQDDSDRTDPGIRRLQRHMEQARRDAMTLAWATELPPIIDGDATEQLFAGGHPTVSLNERRQG